MMIQVLLREYCKFPVEMGLVGDAFIDTACLNVPKCAPAELHDVRRGAVGLLGAPVLHG